MAGLQSAGEEQLEAAQLTVVRLRLLLGAALLIAAGTLHAADPAPTQDFNTLIARLDAEDPHSPRALEMHLRHANFLALSETGECAPRLQAAQAEWDRVRANPALDVVLPAGRAREADVGYLIHLARAHCGAAAERDDELRAALAAAQRSAALYRDEFDYVSMATMQFNAALALEKFWDRRRRPSLALEGGAGHRSRIRISRRCGGEHGAVAALATSRFEPATG